MRRVVVFAACVLMCVLLTQGTAIAGPYVMLGGQTYNEVGPTETVSVTFTTPDGGISAATYFGLVKLTVEDWEASPYNLKNRKHRSAEEQKEAA